MTFKCTYELQIDMFDKFNDFFFSLQMPNLNLAFNQFIVISNEYVGIMEEMYITSN